MGFPLPPPSTRVFHPAAAPMAKHSDCEVTSGRPSSAHVLPSAPSMYVAGGGDGGGGDGGGGDGGGGDGGGGDGGGKGGGDTGAQDAGPAWVTPESLYASTVLLERVH